MNHPRAVSFIVDEEMIKKETFSSDDAANEEQKIELLPEYVDG